MYVDAIAKANVVWPTRSPQDMFPYKDFQATYWTGYFTSRPQLKNYIKEASAVFHSASSDPIGASSIAATILV